MIKNSQPFWKKCQKTLGGYFFDSHCRCCISTKSPRKCKNLLLMQRKAFRFWLCPPDLLTTGCALDPDGGTGPRPPAYSPQCLLFPLPQTYGVWIKACCADLSPTPTVNGISSAIRFGVILQLTARLHKLLSLLTYSLRPGPVTVTGRTIILIAIYT